MHKSMLAGLIIDCQIHDIDSAAGFWSHALGLKTQNIDDPDLAEYVQLSRPAAPAVHTGARRQASKPSPY